MKAQVLVLSEAARGGKLRKNLETGGFQVVIKETILAGLDVIKAYHPDLIVVGSHLRDRTIIEVCRALRQFRYTMPIIVYVEQADEYDRILTLEIGADDYITEVTNPRELAARIRAHLRRAYEFSKPDADVLHVGDLVIDCTRGQAFREMRSLDLTPIEFRMLVLLAQHRGQVLSREQILYQIWGHGSQPYGEEMVNVHVCRLRRKVEGDPFRPSLIVTVRGLGYRLVSSFDCVAERML